MDKNASSTAVAKAAQDPKQESKKNEKKNNHNHPNNDNPRKRSHRQQQDEEIQPQNKEKKPKKVKPKRNTDPDVLEMRRTIQQCCARNDLATALEAYQTAQRNDVSIEACSFYNLLALCDGLELTSSVSGVHVGTPKNPKPKSEEEAEQDEAPIRSVSLEDRKRHAFEIKQQMVQDKGFPLNEVSYTSLLKILVKCGDLEQAHQLLTEAEHDTDRVKVKLRLYSPLLLAYCGQTTATVTQDSSLSNSNKKNKNDGNKSLSIDLVAALKIWQRLTRHELALTEREYVGLLQGCVAATKTSPAMRAAVVDRVLGDLAQEVLVPSRAGSRVLQEWFASPAARAVRADDHSNNDEDEDDTVTQILNNIQTMQQEQHAALEHLSLGPVQNAAGWTVTAAAEIDPTTGILKEGCLQGLTLQPVQVTPKTWEFMKQANETIVQKGGLEQHKSKFQGGKKGKKKRLDDDMARKRQEQWGHFNRFLDRKKNIDVIVDGANVGYYQQNFEGAPKHLDYHKLDWMIQHLMLEKKSLLVFLHIRHIRDAPRQYDNVIQNWKDAQILYTTPFGMNDDWFWLHAALRFHSLVVTNDEMRDHHFQMLAPRSFLSWKDRHQVHFSFGVVQSGSGTARQEPQPRQVLLQYPERYSRRIQRLGDNGLVIPLPKRGDENRFLDGKHVEEDDNVSVQERYACIRANK